MTSLQAKELDALFEEGLAQEVFSGASFAMGRGAKIVHRGAFGRIGLPEDSPGVDDGTLFDLASLTKPLATTLAVMGLVAESKTGLDDTLARVFGPRGVPEDKRDITVRMLLDHTSGLPAHRPYFQDLLPLAPGDRRPALFEMLMAEPLESPPGSRREYSDLGFMLLMFAVEARAGEGLPELAHETYAGLGVDDLVFSPRERPGMEGRVFAATGFAPETGEPLSGVVHDDNARALYGRAGHAGLFGTAVSVARLAGIFHDSFMGRGPLAKGVVTGFLTAAGGRPLGFDTASGEESSAGRGFSPMTVGHLGFTGTSFWLDLKDGKFAVLLTNRVLTDPEAEGIKSFRPRFHDLAAQLVDSAAT